MSLQSTSKIALFIDRMKENVEQAQWGFDSLLRKRADDFEEFFDHLNDAGLFSPEHNSGPVPATQPGYVQVPYWHALDYLKAVAKRSGDRNDEGLAWKVMQIVHNVTLATEPDGTRRDNYHTYTAFAEILGSIPLSAVAAADIDLAPIWLESRYDRGGVARALDVGVLHQLLKSADPAKSLLACRLLRYCTAIQWIPDGESESGASKPVTVVDKYWLKKLISHHSKSFGILCGAEASVIFAERLGDLYKDPAASERSWLDRPAIEDHQQNHAWEDPINSFVDGLRDVLLNFVATAPDQARGVISDLLQHPIELVRRVVIYVTGQHWNHLRTIGKDLLTPAYLVTNYLHEMYGLLRDQFPNFTDEEKAAALAAIRQIPRPEISDDPDRLHRRIQRKWLSAINGKGHAEANAWYTELDSDPSIRPIGDNPDFNSYMTSWVGPGPSRYSVDQLAAFAEDGTLIERLNQFRDADSWDGPTTRALSDTLAIAVRSNPERFLHLLPGFLAAKRPYQYAVIEGFRTLWEGKSEGQDPDWPPIWQGLIDFFEKLLSDPGFWSEEVIEDRNLAPNRDWIPPVIADLLRAGTRNDEMAYPADLLPRGLEIIRSLLARLPSEIQKSEDAMNVSINVPRGKAIETLIIHALRVCRIEHQASGNHVNAWANMRPIFDNELEKCTGGNYEFSTLAGAYLANLDYLSQDWLQENITRLFPLASPVNMECALEGLAYAPATRRLYALLRDNGVTDWGLQHLPPDHQSREKLIERIALAYIWGDEELDHPRLGYLLDSHKDDDLIDVTKFLWSIHNQPLKPEQVDRIVQFWTICDEAIRSREHHPSGLLSALSLLAAYLTSVGAQEEHLLQSVAPYVNTEYNMDEFIEQLDRLLSTNPPVVSSVLWTTITTQRVTWDYEDKIKTIITRLAEHGLLEDAIRNADHLRHLPGMRELYEKLTHSARARID